MTQRMVSLAAGLLLVASVGAPKAFAQGPTVEQPDKYTWLEDIHSEKSMEWVKAENARTAEVMEKQKPFAELNEEALKVLDSPDKLASPQFLAGMVYNTWRDKDHVRGIVRRTTLESYLTDDPKWETIIDYDALGKQDKQSWVGHGLGCMPPEDEHCMVALSASGEDAATLREFNLKTGTFIEDGFVMPRGKQRTAWVDKDTLLIGRDWGAGTMSTSGYPLTVRQWKRGTPLDSAKEIYRGETKDMGVDPHVIVDGQGHHAVILERLVTFFEHENYILLTDGPKKLGLPPKSSLEGMQDGQLLVSLEQDWTPEGQTKSIAQGTVISLDLRATQADPVHLKPTIVFAPTEREFAQQVVTTKNHAAADDAGTCAGARVCLHAREGRRVDAGEAADRGQPVDRDFSGKLAGRQVLPLGDGISDALECAAGRCCGRFSEKGKDTEGAL